MVDSIHRPGNDQGYLMKRHDLAGPSFNSTKPRFNYTQQISTEMAKPGPGTYDTPVRQSDMYHTFNDSNSIFKDRTQKMEGFNALHGHIKHENKLGPGEYYVENAFVSKTFNRSLPPAKFV